MSRTDELIMKYRVVSLLNGYDIVLTKEQAILAEDDVQGRKRVFKKEKP